MPEHADNVEIDNLTNRNWSKMSTQVKRRDAIMFLPAIQAAALALALIVAHSVRADFEAGQRALDAGSVDEALTQWRTAADAGDVRAMLALGRLYRQGRGVIQDYVEAHKWFNLAASRGEAAALEERDALAAKMAPEQVAAAQAQAAAWQSGGHPAGATPGGGSAQAGESPPVSAPAPDAAPPPAQALREAQSLLAALGYQPGPADGSWSRSTEAAYRAFLRDAGLPQAETLTPQALLAMRTLAERESVGATTSAAGTVPASAPTGAGAPRPAPVNPDVLHQAAQAGDIDMLKAALTAGVEVDARDSRGWTALMHAANKGYLLLVSELLDAPAAVDIRAPDGATALFIAVAHGHTEIVELLMKAGADIRIRGPQGRTPVKAAQERYGEGYVESSAVQALLKGETCEEIKEEKAQIEQIVRELAEGMVSIPAGKFRMGSKGKDAYDDEKPVHRVKMPAFKLGKHEVTFAQWDACVADGGCDYSPDDQCWGRGNQPVIGVSWDDAQSFIAWLNSRTGGHYRLPTEAEWEYAARAGATTKYSWGNDIGGNRANCGDGCGDSYEYTAPVGSFPANAWGLNDMHGNAWEWVQDCYNDSYRGAPNDGSAWESGNCGWRGGRGGSWGNNARHLRSANRSWGGRAGRNDFASGFRLAQDE